MAWPEMSRGRGGGLQKATGRRVGVEFQGLAGGGIGGIEAFEAVQQGGEPGMVNGSTYDFLPRPLDEKHFLFTSHHKGNSDVWKLPLDGTMPNKSGLEESVCSEWEASYSCVLVLNNAEVSSRTRYRLARQYLGLGHVESARPILKQILEEGTGEYQGLAKIELLLLNFENEELKGEAGLKQLEKIIADYAGVITVEARGLLEMGNLSLALEKTRQGVEIFSASDWAVFF